MYCIVKIRLISDQLHPYQVIVRFADGRCVEAFWRTLQSARLGGNLFVCNQGEQYIIIYIQIMLF